MTNTNSISFYVLVVVILSLACPNLSVAQGKLELAKMHAYNQDLLRNYNDGIRVIPRTREEVDSVYTARFIDSTDIGKIYEITRVSDPDRTLVNRILLSERLHLLYGYETDSLTIYQKTDATDAKKLASALTDFEYEPDSFDCESGSGGVEDGDLRCTKNGYTVTFRSVGEKATAVSVARN